MDGMENASDLLHVEIGEELRSMLERYPLPKGVQDADMNQEEIAQALNTTVNTIAKWIRQDEMPVVQQGGNGKAYGSDRAGAEGQGGRHSDAEGGRP